MSRTPELLASLPFIPVLVALLFFGAMSWAKGRDPFERTWFNVRPHGGPKTECVALLPKTALRPLPVVIYLHGWGGSLLTSGNELRQMAEMGLAAVGMEYDQTNEAVSAGQFAALLEHVQRQPWADTNRVAWVGLSLGAQRQLAFALAHPDTQPKLLVRLSGGWSRELEKSTAASAAARVASANETGGKATPRFSALLIHAERDEVCPLAEAQWLMAWLRTNGVPVELKVMPGLDHGLQPNRLILCRAIGEYCLLHLRGSDGLSSYNSILAWRAQAKPLWLSWSPALLWAGFRAVRRWSRRRATNAARAHGASTSAPRRSTRGQVALWWAAGTLSLAALSDTALHLLPPRFAVSNRTLSLARKHLVPPKQLADFDFASRNPVWRGKRLGLLLEHVELANYNRELIDWKLDDNYYRDFVLSPQIDPELDGDLNWRRALWENFYPRIRKQATPEGAAIIVARFLRERVTIAPQPKQPASGQSTTHLSESLAEIWHRQITDMRGFDALYVAALRSVGVPSRLDPRHRAEFWTRSAWQPAPRPVLEQWD